MKRVGLLVLAVAVLVAVITAMASGSSNSRKATSVSRPPAWGTVAPVFSTKCTGCHRLSGIAPFALTDPRAAKAHARAILSMTQAGRMPPWMPGHDSPQYIGQALRRLTTAEKRSIARWVRGGARIRGAKPIRPSTVTSKAPGTTLKLTVAKPYMPKAAIGGMDDYHCFVLEPHLDRDVFVTSAVVKPQRAAIVHHVILFEAAGDNAAEARRLNAQSGSNGWTCFGGPGLTETNPSAEDAGTDRLGAPQWIAAWVPGHANNDLPSRTGVLVHKGSALVMQVHYNLIHPPQRDRSSVALRVTPAATSPLTALDTMLVPAPVELACPRGGSSRLCSREAAVEDELHKYGAAAALIPSALLYLCGKTLSDYPSTTTSCNRRVNRPLRIYGVAGHMHLRGVDIRVDLNPGTSAAKTLLHIPHWDFHWQDAYYLSKPIDANVGDTIRVTCRFDNSRKRQPVVNGKRRPPRYVLWGEGTTDEMCLGLLQVANRSG